ncbi:MAG: hypothetical protein GYA21_13575 [Myxococcales bacterium]|nr:hypothetical protein [Myxococcales bacterium]
MRTEPTILGLLLLGLVTGPARAGEAFPGQADLAAGLACLSNLDTDCARSRLEQALSRFSPEADPDFVAHVIEARQRLAVLAVARDDLTEAEAQFVAILAIDDGFSLPDADPPPKVRYVFEQAQKRRAARKVRATRPPLTPIGAVPDDAASAAVTSGGSAVPAPPPPAVPITTVEKKGASPVAPESRSTSWQILAGADGGGIFLFGRDAEALAAGPGASLSLGCALPSDLWLRIHLAWGRHEASAEDGVLQHLSAVASGAYAPRLGSVRLRLGGGAGALATGTRDRYDHWGALLQAETGLSWPASGALALSLSLRPSLFLTADGASFFLSASAGMEFSWPIP